MKRMLTITLAAVVLAMIAGCSGDEVTNINDPDTTPPTTTAVPPGWTYTHHQLVSLLANENATIYYTTDGSDPDTSSTVYSAPLRLNTDTTLKFFAVDGAGNTEVFKTEIYVFPYLSPFWTTPTGITTDSLGWRCPTPAMDPNDVLHVVHFQATGGSGDNHIIDSTDWTTRTNVTNVTAPTTTDWAKAASDSNGVIHVAWRESVGGTNWEIFYANSSGWSGTRTNLSNTADSTGDLSLCVDGNDTTHVVWVQNIGGNRDVIYVNSTNWTTTWANISNIGDDCYDTDMAVDVNNRIHVVWRELTAAEVFTANSFNWALSRSNVSRTTGPSFEPAIAIDSQNRRYVVWQEGGFGTQDIFLSRSTNYDVNTNISNTLYSSYDADVVIDGNEVVHVVWSEDLGGGAGDVFYANSTSWVFTQTNLSGTSLDSRDPAFALDCRGRR
ncbi:MAG: chitobiase/beta-hexosaminidase C-terminal domain-containing protein [Planctomycetota bacterium]|jgi:hypothetical protein